ncbi:MAG: hypothetical protein J6J60_04405 [Clostridia bacterium]|nr:hypothetical protein [Clostridia bacterium]
MKKKNIFVLILILIIICLLFVVVCIRNNDKKNPTAILIETDLQTQKEIQEVVDQALLEKLSGLSEQKRIEYYATEFIKALEGRKISTAYKLLNEDFKKNYFNTEESFGKYVKTYFPKEVSVKYVNMERLENLYVLEVEIKDILNSDEPNHFDCYIVVKENGYADYELSFSVDSAMKNSQADEEVEEVDDDDENTEKIEDSDEIYENADESSEEFEDDNVIYESDDEIQEDTEEIEETEE